VEARYGDVPTAHQKSPQESFKSASGLITPATKLWMSGMRVDWHEAHYVTPVGVLGTAPCRLRNSTDTETTTYRTALMFLTIFLATLRCDGIKPESPQS
jgi:hypothetical protein